MARANEVKGGVVATRLAAGLAPATPEGQTINEPTILGSMMEAEKWISVMEQRLARTREVLMGPWPTAEGNQVMPTTMESLASNICSRAASLCGDIETINQRLGARPE